MIPIVHIHYGYSDYLEFSLRQAAWYNPQSPIVLIGNHTVTGIDCIPIDEFQAGAAEFADVYRHLSTNRFKFELRCFQRWFVLRDVARTHGWTEIIVCDSDVLLFACLEDEVRERLNGESLGLAVPEHQPDYRYSASGHTSYWTVDALEEFCDFCLHLYKNEQAYDRLIAKWEHDRKTGENGGVCDMTALYLFSIHVESGRVLNLLLGHEGSTVDHRITSADNYKVNEFVMVEGVKAITIRDSVPYGRLSDSDEEIRFISLHFQGKVKYLMRDHYHGPTFSGMGMIYLRRKLYSIAATSPIAGAARWFRRTINDVSAR